MAPPTLERSRAFDEAHNDVDGGSGAYGGYAGLGRNASVRTACSSATPSPLPAWYSRSSLRVCYWWSLSEDRAYAALKEPGLFDPGSFYAFIHWIAAKLSSRKFVSKKFGE